MQEEKNVCAQWLAEKGIGAVAICGRRVWNAHDGARWTRRQEGCLEKGPLDPFQVGFPELQVTTGDEGGSYGIVEDIFDSKLGDNAGLKVGNPKFLCHFVASLWGKDIGRFDWSVGQEEIKMSRRQCSDKDKK